MSAALDNPATLPAALRYFVRHASPRLVFVLTLATLGYRLTLGHFDWRDAAIVAGVLAAWPLLEWLIHVFVLHFEPFELRGRTIDPFVSAKHRAHHRDPWRLDTLFIPLRSYWLTVPLIFVSWPLLFDGPQAFTGIAFVFAMTLHYEWVHFLVHTRYTPKTAPYRRMWRHHRLHHCKNEHYWLGVTTQLGDRLLGTAADSRDVPTSATCRTLGHEDTLGT